MAELKDKELNEVAGGSFVGASDSVDPLRSTSPEEELGGRVIVVPTDEVIDAGL